MLSVSSSTRSCGGIRLRSTAPRTACQMVPLLNCGTATLTETDRRGQSLLMPGRDLCTRRAQDPLADLDDEPGLLGDGDELVGRQDAELRMPPAQQRFRAGDPAGGDLDLGLVEQHELALVDGLAHLPFQRHALGGVRVHLVGEERVGLAAALLGLVHRHFGVLEQRVGILAVSRRHGDADARAHAQLVTVDVERLGQRVLDAPRHGGGIVHLGQVVQIGQQRREAVAADAGERHRCLAAASHATA